MRTLLTLLHELPPPSDRFDAWKRISTDKSKQRKEKSLGQPCGRGWEGLRGACKRAKKGMSQEERAAIGKESRAELASKIRATKGKLKKSNTGEVEGLPQTMKEVRTSKKLETLKSSLEKKQANFDKKLEDHFATVKQASGQPLNDKRNGPATLRNWEKQSDALRNLKEGIEKTQRAIEREELTLAGVDEANKNIPKEISQLIEAGDLQQWRKNPNTFFVAGVDKARIVWDEKKRQVSYKYLNDIKDKEQWRKFAKIYNDLAKRINK